MRPIDVGVIRPVEKPGCLGPMLGAVGLLVAAVFGVIGLLSIASDPLLAILELAIASAGGVAFVRAAIADRRRRGVEHRTIHRRPAAAAGQGALRYVDDGVSREDPMAIALGTLLDDPERLGHLDIEGTGSMRLHFQLLSTDPTVLRGEATGLSRLDPADHPGPDAQFGLISLGWAAPAPPSREDFAAEWSLPVDLAGLAAFIDSTAWIYNVEPAVLRPRFGGLPTATNTAELAETAEPAEPNALRGQTDSATVGGPARGDLSGLVGRWSRHPVVRWGWFAIAVLYLIVGPARFKELFGLLPPWLPSGAIGLVALRTGAQYVIRYRRTSDPFTLSGWDRWRGRTVTNYESHFWWGIFGAALVVVGLAFLAFAVSEFG
jgi:hypothetical protein